MRESKLAASTIPTLLQDLDRIEYRRIQQQEDLEEVGRLRAKCYKQVQIIPVEGDILIDEADYDPQAYVFGLYYDEMLISTVRIHHVTPEHRTGSSVSVFPEETGQFLDAGMTLIDPVRFAMDTDSMISLPNAKFLTMRIATMAMEFFEADRCLSLVSPKHSAFYKRIFAFKTVVPPRSNCGNYIIPLTLMACDFHANRHWIYETYPYLMAKTYEMRMMFAPLSELRSSPLTVLPTARYAIAAAAQA